MKKSFRTAIYSLLLAVAFSAKAQIVITGPACVIPGTSYQYTITGKWTEGATMQLCINGGVLAASGKTCEEGVIVSTIKIMWDSTDKGSISLNSAEGNSSLAVNITTSLSPGNIETNKRRQVIEFDALPASITGTPATGGACSSEYKYQWQQSADNMTWIDIEGATAEQLQLSTKFRQTLYYRRKVTETHSNTIAFTKVAVVFVNPATGDHQ